MIQNSVQYITEYTVYNLVKLSKNSLYENEINYEYNAVNVALTVLSRHLERMQISSTGMQKALHTKGMYSHLENYVMTWGRTKATM